MNTGVRNITRNGLLAFVAFGVILLVGGRMYPQVVGATLSGTVMDQSGAAIPNAQVSIKNVATGVTRNIAPDTAAFYTASNLLPGNYEITVAAPEFATQVRTGIILEVGAQQVLKITMQVGQITQKVQVTGEAPTVQLATSSISAVVNSTMVRELPLNGRSNLRGNAGRNILIGPGTSNLDLSVFKNNYIKRISENFNVQFRAEIFNILNHANFAVPVSPDHTTSSIPPGRRAGLLDC
jgi:hypothetical protein